MSAPATDWIACLPPRLLLAGGIALSAGSACTASDPLGPDQLADVRIDVDVGGGFAGVQYSFRVEAGEVVGVSCAMHCPLQVGEVVLALSAGQQEELDARLVESGILNVGERDYGFSCCDQFIYRIRYRDATRASDITGDADTFPAGLAELASALRALAHGWVPARVEAARTRADLPSDPFSIDSLSVSGPGLTVFVRHGGGCATHTFDLVFVEGWLESFPAQIRAQLVHEDRGDPCEAAALPRTVRFDLLPLIEAYRSAYGRGTSGHRILVTLGDPGDGSGAQGFEVEVP